MPQSARAIYLNITENGGPQTNSSCPYKCEPDLTDYAENQSCLTNFELFLTYIGGRVVFFLSIAGTILVAVFAIILLFMNKKKKKNKALRVEELEADEELN